MFTGKKRLRQAYRPHQAHHIQENEYSRWGHVTYRCWLELDNYNIWDDSFMVVGVGVGIGGLEYRVGVGHLIIY